MGGGASTYKQQHAKLECPKGYSTAKFESLLRHFDAMDKNGDHALIGDESLVLANMHVGARASDVKIALLECQQDLDREFNALETEKQQRHKDVDAAFQERSSVVVRRHNDRFATLETELKTLYTMSPAAKLDAVRDAVGTEVTFDTFFEFSKDMAFIENPAFCPVRQ